jgi:type I restriction enzyme R subunit
LLLQWPAGGLKIFHPEDHARTHIDSSLATAGWVVQTRAQMNLGAGVGVAVQEFPTDSGPVDYALFVGRELCGVIEAKPAGTTLSGFAEQAARYISDVPEHLVRRQGQVRFEYVASSSETLFRDHADPAPRSRRVFTFHRPETLQRWLTEDGPCAAASGRCRPGATAAGRVLANIAVTGRRASSEARSGKRSYCSEFRSSIFTLRPSI